MRKKISQYAWTLLLLAGMPAAGNAQPATDSLWLETSAANFAQQLLQGKIPGVRISATDGNPQGPIEVNIRGIHSLRSDNQPLWVVDGAILGDDPNRQPDAFWQYGTVRTAELNPLAFLSPADIERIEVLKDASATALYGKRGANGVILVTTRKGSGKPLNIDWQTNVTAYPAASHNHHLSINGTKNGTSYNLSAYFRNLAGTLERNESDYGGVRLNIETAAGNALTFGFNSHLTIGRTSNSAGAAWFGEGSATLAARDLGLSTTPYAGWVAGFDDNDKETRTVNSAYLTVRFTPALQWTTRLGLDYQKHVRVMWFGNETEFGRQNNGAAAVLNSQQFTYDASTSLSYSRFIAGDHRIDASAGIETTGSHNRYNTMNGTNFFTHELRGDGLSLMQSEKSIRKFMKSYRTAAGVARIAYDWQQIVALDAGVRAEATPRYDGSTPGWYPWANLKVDLRKALFAGSTAVSSAALDGGYGRTGREYYSPCELLSERLAGGYPEISADGAVYHDGLNHVTSDGYHLGAELGFASNRLRVHVAYYNDRISDRYEIYSFGALRNNFWNRAPRERIFSREACFTSRGWELDLSADLIRNAQWHWSLSLNGAWEGSRIDRIDLSDQPGLPVGEGVTGTAQVAGRRLGSVSGYLEHADGSYVDLNRDGRITQADKTLLGNTTPEFHGAIATTLRFKGLTLDILANGAAKFDIVNLHTLARSGKPDISSGCIERGDYLRLSRLSLGYDIPLHRAWIESLRVCVSGLNLLTWTSYSGWNPEVDSFGPSVLRRGYDYGSYPLMKSIVIGVSAKF